MTAIKNQAKQSANIGRKCSVCSHERVKEINSAINKPLSFRVISRQFWGDEKHHDSVQRHTNNCLKLEIHALIKEKKIENAIDHYEEIGEQLRFAKDLRLAARDYLSSPATGEITLIPRASEVSVVYEDYSDTTPRGEPKRKTDSLDMLLERIESGNVEPKRTIIKHVDIRSFALDATRTTDIVLDKIAKIEGLYKKDNEQKNPPKISSDDDLARSLFNFLFERFIKDNMEQREKETILEKITARVEQEFPKANVKLLGDGSNYSSLTR